MKPDPGKEESTATKPLDYYAVTHLEVASLAHSTRILTECRPHICSICKYPFPFKSLLDRHFRNHTGEKPFPCSYCPRSFRQKTHLDRHEMVHRGERNFLCSFCPKTYCLSYDLTHHITTAHLGIRSHSCQDCSKSYFKSSSLLAHRRRNHNLGLPYLCKKSGCGKKYAEGSQLIRHMKSKHGILLPYECSKCKQRFKTKVELVCHEDEGIHKSGLQDDDQDIELIKWAFSQEQQQNALNHSASVNRSRVKKYDENSKRSTENTNKPKKKHGKEENDMEMMEAKENQNDESSSSYCGYCSCGRTFYSRELFRRHRKKRGHSRAKVHECPICLMTFKTIKGLEPHYYSHDLKTRKLFEKSGYCS